MSFFEITGRRRLSGRLAVQGAKNSVLPILAACILSPGECVIRNCPDLSDVTATLQILRGLGCKVRREADAVIVDASGVNGGEIPEHLMREMRSSVIFLGAILARLGQAQISYPGGCELGPRPIDLHLDALRRLGAQIWEEDGVLHCRTPGGLRGCRIHLPFPSVGATENTMLAACGSQQTTTIVGAAREPEIEDLQNFLNALGARVTGAGSDVITVQGSTRIGAAEHTVMADRIVAATYLSAVGAAGGELELTGVCPEHLSTVLDVMEEAGCVLHTEKDLICLRSNGRLNGVRPVRTAPYPGFPTDAQAVVMAALASGQGETVFEENIFRSRYRHVSELARMGADIRLTGRTAVVRGAPLRSAHVCSTDLRGGAALVIAALAAEGTSRVGELHHIDRGYDHLELKLSGLDAAIERKHA
ncbi:MAG: UDP-N-acetylglucosamine 1-carboxyvinyltransferase [Ruminococcaceae bacterium]|nr:UDP-N-acetylglucosamine 1-carboxyvinyltransferase [Oscillospiraceae bacterium]